MYPPNYVYPTRRHEHYVNPNVRNVTETKTLTLIVMIAIVSLITSRVLDHFVMPIFGIKVELFIRTWHRS